MEASRLRPRISHVGHHDGGHDAPIRPTHDPRFFPGRQKTLSSASKIHLSLRLQLSGGMAVVQHGHDSFAMATPWTTGDIADDGYGKQFVLRRDFSRRRYISVDPSENSVPAILRVGAKGAFQMGLKPGSTCVGCCWAQMLIMFAVGVMSLLGMALITLLILLEKVVPARNMLIPRAGGPILMGWGVWLLAVA